MDCGSGGGGLQEGQGSRRVGAGLGRKRREKW